MRHITLGIVGILCAASIAQAADNSWLGSYAGGSVGGLKMKGDGQFDPLPNVPFFGVFPNSGGLKDTGFVGGLHVGRNWPMSSPSWVAGIEADWSWTDTKGSFSQPWTSILGPTVRLGSVTSMSLESNWLATIRGRVGKEVSPGTLVYFTGGLAIADVDYRASANNEFGTYVSSVSSSKTATGYVLGGGVEWALRDRWSLRAEYLFNHLNTKKTATAFDSTGTFAPPLGSSFTWDDTDLHMIRIGASYKF